MKLVSVAQMKSIEAVSDAAGHSYAAMMDRAGAAVAQAIQQRVSVKGRRVLLLVGPGNNGGDGLVAALHLRQAGAEVACYLLQTRDDARAAAAREAGAFIAALPDDRGLRVLRRFSLGADVVVDALFGTGARLPLPADAQKLLNTIRGEIQARRARMNGVNAPTEPSPLPSILVVAVDGPSGMDFDSGAIDPATLPADLSVTFAYPKLGHTRFPAAESVGQLIIADIGTDPSLASEVALELADADLVRPLLPARPAGAHKGTFGKVMIVAGSIHYTGAPALAALAAYRSGAGLVTLAVPRSIVPIVAGVIEATFLPLPDALGVITEDAVPILSRSFEGYRVLLLGPGLTREKEAVAFVDRLLGGQAATRKPIGFGARPGVDSGTGHLDLPPLVVDADGLNILSDMQEGLRRLPESSILTPHIGEMARLTRMSVDAIEADRVGTAAKFAQQWRHVVVLKGAFTVVAGTDDRVVVMPFANPALATAGSGDVLAGTIAGLRAQGLAAFEAALCGAYLHGLAGELARREIGGSGVVASDLAARLPAALRSMVQT